MLTHKQVWNAIDTIAERYGFSASGLAKKSGLDPTSFNPSKRNGPDGRPRWPTMESISRLLQASGASMEEFSELLIGRRGQPPKLRQIPLLGLAKAGKGGFFDDSGFPAGNGWDDRSRNAKQLPGPLWPRRCFVISTPTLCATLC